MAGAYPTAYSKVTGAVRCLPLITSGEAHLAIRLPRPCGRPWSKPRRTHASPVRIVSVARASSDYCPLGSAASGLRQPRVRSFGREKLTVVKSRLCGVRQVHS